MKAVRKDKSDNTQRQVMMSEVMNTTGMRRVIHSISFKCIEAAGNLRQRPTMYQHVDRPTYVLTKQM